MVIPKVVDNWSQLISGLGVMVRITPKVILEQILSASLNQFLQAEIKQQRFSFLPKQWVRIEVPDLAFHFSVTLNDQGRLKASLTPQPAAVTMRGNSASLLLMISGKVDPDTLFFKRKLMIKGDTELGLEVKNLLDTIELEGRLPKPLFRVTQATADAIVARPELR
ncbi:ubiquinone anaerobic biosynthesis accessory factor UbiT [Pseudidiomarina woesei]|uniref:Predicted lipid carrier protein YhbT, SCP2 domain n=1 Tax=Pseudidiomarina woesei TaxID=1381080 RepID=A0A0K6H5L9_9GAMM|nr:SCP2 sterol-binding domain-containing protein [Pseudidiomarina woesei]CUA86192.1 Predicted lipid carrier protein YhbT, SCP2 domain [Pseudidiomarina woesei]